MPKQLNVRVTTMEAELEFAIQPQTTGKQLFDQVVKTIGLRELWFFALQYTDSKGYTTWLKLNKKVLSQDIKKENTLQFKFRAKFFPEDVSEELIQDITIRLFYLQVKNSILSDEIFCPAETSVLLASYACLAKFGDYNEDSHGKPSFLSNERLLPQRVIECHTFTREQWEERIIIWWKEHKGMSREDSMLEYLRITQDLEMYGINYFEIKNKKGTELYLGVDALGLNIYDKEDKLTPKIGFPWGEIRNISFNDKKFVIKPINKKSPDFVFLAPRLRINKRILALCMGNHELYMRRRRSDPIDIQQMKQQAKEEKEAKKKDREKLLREIELREAAERKQAEYAEQCRLMQEEMEKRDREIFSAQDKVKLLEDKLSSMQLANDDLEKKTNELENLMKQLEQSKEMEVEEKSKLEDEIRIRQDEVQKMQSEVDQKNEETQRLKDEIAEAKKEKENLLAASSTPQHHNLKEDEHDECDDEMINGIEQCGGTDLEVREDISRPEEERETEISKKKTLQKQLEILSKDLEAAKDETKITKNDLLHQENVRQGRDKYKTLREIRKGNTKRRVDQFENM